MEPINESETDWHEHDGVEGTFRQKQLGAAGGSTELGCSLYELEPGCQPWSYHYHAANEEALYILSGSGTLTLDGAEYDISAGDFVPCLADERGGHAIENDGSEPLRYLAVSTMNEPDVTLHPHIQKLGVYVGSPPGSNEERTVSAFFDRKSEDGNSE